MQMRRTDVALTRRRSWVQIPPGPPQKAPNQRGKDDRMASLDMFLLDLLKATVALFVIVDPLGPVPIFAGLTKTMSLDEKRKVFRTAAVIGAVLLAVFALVGQEVLLLFGISLESFQIAGGLVLLLLSIEIIFRGERFDKLALVSAEETAVFPIAFPLLVGPGAITLTLISIQTFGITVALLAIVIVMFASWVVLRQTDRIYRMLGRTGSAVIARIMSLFIAAIAVQYILAGIQFYYPPR